MADDNRVDEVLLEEYRICHERAAALEQNVWTSATVLGAGSVAGILALAAATGIPAHIRPWVAFIVSVFAISLLLSWRRIAGRWWSVEHAYIRRMEHIERQTRLRATLYVGHLDSRIQFSSDPEESPIQRPYLDQSLQDDFGTFGPHQRAGLVPTASFIVEIAIGAWIALALLFAVPAVIDGCGACSALSIRLLLAAVFFTWFIWRLVYRFGQV